MRKNIADFMATEFKSKAKIVDEHRVEVTDPNGENYFIISHNIGRLTNEEIQKYILHVFEGLSDKYVSEDIEMMFKQIRIGAMRCRISIMGFDLGERKSERVRIGNRIRQIRTEKNIEAREFAKMVGIDAGNLSRIETGKHSVGFDLLGKIANALGYKVDFVEIKK